MHEYYVWSFPTLSFPCPLVTSFHIHDLHLFLDTHTHSHTYVNYCIQWFPYSYVFKVDYCLGSWSWAERELVLPSFTAVDWLCVILHWEVAPCKIFIHKWCHVHWCGIRYVFSNNIYIVYIYKLYVYNLFYKITFKYINFIEVIFKLFL